DGTIRHWDPATGKEKASPLQAHKGPLTALAYSRDGSLLASGGRNRTVKVWETATGKLKAKLGGHTEPIWSLAFSPDGKTLAVGTGLGHGGGGGDLAEMWLSLHLPPMAKAWRRGKGTAG